MHEKRILINYHPAYFLFVKELHYGCMHHLVKFMNVKDFEKKHFSVNNIPPTFLNMQGIDGNRSVSLKM